MAAAVATMPMAMHVGGGLPHNPSTAGLDDLFDLLDAGTERLRQEDYACGRRQNEPGIIIAQDQFLAKSSWRPSVITAAKREAAQLFEKGVRAQPRFVSGPSGTGDFDAPTHMKSEYMEPLQAGRVMQPDRSFAKSISGQPSFRSGQTSSELPKAADDLCGEQHRAWLARHATDRDRHLHPVYHALTRVDQLKLEASMARDAAKCCGNDEEAVVYKSKADNLEQALEKAQSHQALAADRLPGLTNFNKWTGTKGVGSSFQERSPWQAASEQRVLSQRPGPPGRQCTLRAVESAREADRLPAIGDITVGRRRSLGPQGTARHRSLERAATDNLAQTQVTPQYSSGGSSSNSYGRTNKNSNNSGNSGNKTARLLQPVPPTAVFGASRASSARPRTGGGLASAGGAVVGRS